MGAGPLEKPWGCRVLDGIFISYRREDSAGYAGRLYDRLAAHFGAERVFMDVEGIAPGTDFVDAIERAVTSCKVLIVLIGKEWTAIQDNSGRRRLDDPNDFIRLETSTALKRDIRVVPVLVEGALMPRADELPDELSGLSRRQAIEVSHKQWEASTGNLIEALDKIYFPDAVVEPSPTTAGSEVTDFETSPPPPPPRWRWLAVGVILLLVGGWLAERWLLPGDNGDDVTINAITREAQVPIVTPETGQVDARSRTTDPAEDASSEQKPVTEPVVIAAGPTPEIDHPADPKPGRLEVDPRQVDLGTITLGTQDSALIRLRNSGDGDLPVPGLEGTKVAGLTIVQHCPEVLAPGQSCRMELVVKPLKTGPLNIRFGIQSVNETPLSVALIGQVVEKVVPPVKEPILASPGPPTVVSKPDPPPEPKILRFGSKVSGKAVELCYRTANAEQATISPRPGRLKNPHRGCVTVSITERTTFRIVVQGADRRASDSLVATPESPPAPVVTPEATAGDGGVGDPVNNRLPNVGDQWTYRIRGRWASSPKQTVRVSLVSVTSAGVGEQLSRLEADSNRNLGQRQVRGPVAYVTQSPHLGGEFSPYLNAYGGVTAQSEWQGIPTPDINSFWTKWYSTGKVEGRESVTLPAGTYDALKLEIWSARAASGGRTQKDAEPVRIRYEIWYAAGIKRYVKMVRTTTAASGQRINTDTFELLDYQQR